MVVNDSPGSPEPLALGRFGTNLTNAARERRLESAIGRDAEIDRIMETLFRRAVSIPLLVGEHGVGKRHVVFELARRIADDYVPAVLRGKQLYALDADVWSSPDGDDAKVALSRALAEIKGRDDILLFIDRFHLAVGAGGTTEANAIGSMLIRGELRAIGATTPAEYRRYLERDNVLGRTLQPIRVIEPSVPHAIEILKSIRDRYEDHHEMYVSDAALVAAVRLSDRYVRDGYLPGKAIELIDQVGSRVGLRRFTGPPDLRDFDERIAALRGEKEAAIDAQDFEHAKGLRDREKELIAERAAYEQAWKSRNVAATPSEVDEGAVIDVVAATTGVPVRELREVLAAQQPTTETEGARTDGQGEHYVLLNDQPVDDADGDLLGTSEIAKGIASALSDSRESSPLVVAVDGGWGMGKSTLLRQIESHLPGGPNVITVRFNAWTAEGENALEGLIKSVLMELDHSVVRRWANRQAKRQRTMLLARVSFSIIARFFGMARLIDELWAKLAVDAKSRNDLRDMIRGMLADWVKGDGRRDGDRTLVVFIDDLDRCSDDVVVRVCEAVKLYLDAPGLIFVIACDLSVLARGVSKSARGASGEGRTYLEKIVQVAYRLPPPDESRVKRLVQGYGQRSGTAELLDEAVTEILATRTGHNPRRIKRILNSLILEHRLNPAWRHAPLGSAQLVRAILLQHLYAPFYDLLIDADEDTDPIGEFLDYAEIRTRIADPPPADHAWWSTTSGLFAKYGLPAPERTPGSESILVRNLETLERELPEPFHELARNGAFIALLRGIGEAENRRALREQLVSRPLGTETALGADGVQRALTTDLDGRPPVSKPADGSTTRDERS